MKTPDVLLDLAEEDFDTIVAHFKAVDTERELYKALRATRQEFGGIPLKEVARTMRQIFDDAEIESLIKELTS